MELKEDSLEYVAIVARRFCNLGPNEPTFEEEAVMHASDVFKSRYANYLNGKKTNEYKKFCENKELQEHLSLHNIDPIKFWYLFLFVDDMAQMCMSQKNIDKEGSFQEEALALASTLPTDREMTDIVKVKISYNEKDTIITNSFLLRYLRETIRKVVDIPIDYPGKTALEEQGFDSYLSYKAQFMKMCLSYFLDAISTLLKPSKMSIVGRMAYLAGYSSDKSLWLGYRLGEIVPPLKERSSVQKWKFNTGKYVEKNGKLFFTEQINIGKKFVDDIKTKTTKNPDWDACDYCYNPYYP